MQVRHATNAERAAAVMHRCSALLACATFHYSIALQMVDLCGEVGSSMGGRAASGVQAAVRRSELASRQQQQQ